MIEPHKIYLAGLNYKRFKNCLIFYLYPIFFLNMWPCYQCYDLKSSLSLSLSHTHTHAHAHAHKNTDTDTDTLITDAQTNVTASCASFFNN